VDGSPRLSAGVARASMELDSDIGRMDVPANLDDGGFIILTHGTQVPLGSKLVQTTRRSIIPFRAWGI